MNTVAERFDEFVVVEPNGCHRWTRAHSSHIKGRLHKPRVWHEGRQKHAHRFAWERVHGPVPEEHHLHHLCRNPGCVNVEHLVCVRDGEHRELHSAQLGLPLGGAVE